MRIRITELRCVTFKLLNLHQYQHLFLKMHFTVLINLSLLDPDLDLGEKMNADPDPDLQS